MKKFLVLFCVLAVFVNESHSQLNRYIVRLKHKGATTYTLTNASPYLSQRAIDRRKRYNISLDSTDLPVPAPYISQIQGIPNITILNISRWLNAVTILTNDLNALAAVNALPFVENSSAIAGRARNSTRDREEVFPLGNSSAARTGGKQSNYFNYGTGFSFNEIHLHNGEFLHNAGLQGQDIQLAMLDGGFFNYTSLNAFDTANANGQFLSTWDFVAREMSVAEDDAHGMSCLSAIAANIPGVFIGTAPRTRFHLFRTEDVSSEYPIEEFNWACGAERSDSVGADIISSSLGYGYGFNSPVPDYPYSDLTGDITMSARAADLAAKKGMLVFNAAGNSGNDYWRMITTPADGDSVVAVGAVNSAGTVGSFSSYGPAPDGRIKPDLAAVGVSALIQTAGNTVAASNGTSYACPKLAGLAACLWQGFPEFNNMKIIQALKEAGSSYSNPNNRIGYGIPDMKKAFVALLTEYASASVVINACNVTISWSSKDIAAMKYEIERKAPGETIYSRIGEVNARPGNILANHSYEFSNPLDSMAAGTISYRIRQVVDTAAATFTAIYIEPDDLPLPSPCILADKIYFAPNPSTGSSAILNVETSYPVSNLQVTAFDIKGNMVLLVTQSKPAGRNAFTLPTGKLGRGKYIVRVYDGKRMIGSTSLLKL